MNPSSSEIVSLFTQALACNSNAERAALLDQACGGNADLREQIELLLRAHHQAGGFLEPKHDPQETVLAASYVSGAIIGQRYKLLEEIAEGGMGTVWLAEQTHPVRRRVAVKLIKPGMDSRQVLSRFEAERQALAVMDHPHIAKVLDGGVTEQGRPYFVMEYVKGVPITQFCDQAKLNVEQRLKLMTQVCQAVQHAHQKGIIHRDLKPSNILVCLYDGQPVPKVIDFGLAKALHQPLTEGTVFTSHGLMVGTPLYMSPEQAEFNNLDIDTRSDVYSLGVILYELLTGSTPLDKQRFQDAAIQEIIRLIKEEEPSKPSLKLSGSVALPSIAAQRSLDPAQLSKLMRGDLDWIVMKSLDKERSRRYETANGLAKDIERYLTDQPVEACPPSTAYKFRKFARRNRLMLGAAGGIAAALIVGISVSTWLLLKALDAEDDAELARRNEAALRIDAEKDRDEAVRQTEIANRARQNEQVALDLAEQRLEDTERERDAARQQSQLALSTLTRIIEDMQASLKNLPGSGEVRRRLLATSLEKLEQVATEYVEQAKIDRNTMLALIAMGDVILQFGVGEEKEDPSISEGEVEAIELTDDQQSAVDLAEQFYTRARDIAQQLSEADPTNTKAQRDLADTIDRLGDVQFYLEGGPPRALEFYQESFNISERLVAADPTNAEALRNLSLAYDNLGDGRIELGEYHAALDDYQQGLNICERLAAVDSSNLQIQRELSIAYNNLGDVQRQLGDTHSALGFYQQGRNIREAMAASDPLNPEWQLYLYGSYIRLGDAHLILEEPQSALDYYQQANNICERLAAADPTNNEVQRHLTVTHEKLGDVHRQLGNMKSALEYYTQMRVIEERLAAVDPSNARTQQDLSVTYLKLGDVHVQLGDSASALDFYTQMRVIIERQTAADPANAQTELNPALVYEKLGNVSLQMGEVSEALAYYQQLLNICQERAASDPNNAERQRDLSVSYEKLGDANLQLGNATEALAFYKKMHALHEARAADDPNDAKAQRALAFSYAKLGDASQQLGDTVATRDFFLQGLSSCEAFAADNPSDAEVQHNIAAIHQRLGLMAGTRLDFDTALEHYTAAIEVLTRMIDNGQLVEQSLQERGGIAALVINLRNEAEQARPLLVDWETFISRPGGRMQLSARIELLARAERFDEIPQSAAMLRSLDAENFVNLYNAACGYALCANAIQPADGAEGEPLTPEQQTQRQEYSDLALDCLRESIAAGWSDLDHMQQDSDLAVLHGLPEFEELLTPAESPPAEALPE